MKKRIMFYADAWNATTGYGKVVRYLATNLSDKYDVYVQQLVSNEPAYVVNGVKIIPAFGTRGSKEFLQSIINNLIMLQPDIFIPICDTFLLARDGLHKIDFAQTKFVPYIPIDSIGVPDYTEEILSKADHILTMSEYGKKQLEDNGYDNITVLYHGVDFEKFKPLSIEDKIKLRLKRNFNENDIVFLTVGRNFPRKRLLRLIEAIALLAKEGYNYTFLFHVADHMKDPWDLTKFIERMEQEHNVELDNIIFTSNHELGAGISEDDLVELYQLSDFYISASSGEGMGMPIIEAMACKNPVILAKNSTAFELTDNGKHGFLAENEGYQYSGFGTKQPLVDVNSLKGKIKEAADKDNTELIESAYSFVKEKCNWEDIVNKIEEVVTNVG